MVKSIILSIKPIFYPSKSTTAEAQASQSCTSIIHIRGSAWGVAVMITRSTLCTQGIGGSWPRLIGELSQQSIGGSSASGEWIREERRLIESPAIHRLRAITGMRE
jgi:hypothetical protein